MPITLNVTENVVSHARQQAAFSELTEAFLRHHGLIGNGFLTPNVIGEVTEIPTGKSFAGGKPAEIAIVELKVPSFALATPEQKAGFVADATDIVERAAEGRLPRRNIWVNMVYAVDGLWGVEGRSLTNAELGQAVAAA